jgi:hypothetical protein
MTTRILLILAFCLSMTGGVVAADEVGSVPGEKELTTPFPSDGETRMARTAWMREAKWGVALHFIREFLDPNRRMTPTQWSALVDQFDVEALADQAEDIGAGLVVIGVSQCGGYFLAPNAAYDKIMGRNEPTTWFPKRDLILDLGKALKKRNIRLMVYLAIDPPIRGDAEAVRVLRPIGQEHPADGHLISSDEGWRIFVGHWEKVVREYSQQWGDSVSGWWFDGALSGQLSYKDSPNWDSFMSATRAGSKDAAISFSHKYRNLRGLPAPREDFFAGESSITDHIVVTSSFRDQCVQNQVLAFLGRGWGTGTHPRYNTGQLTAIADRVVNRGGVVIWDVPFERNGTIKPAFINSLKAFNASVRTPPSAHEEWLKRTGGKMIPEGNLAYRKPALMAGREGDLHGGWLEQFQALLPPNSHVHLAEHGVDGDPNTKAMASSIPKWNIIPWSWIYLVDLLKEETFSRIRIRFGKDGYPTHFVVRVKTEDGRWKQVLEKKDGDGSPVDIRFDELKARHVSIEAIKPNGPSQVGYSMSITELEVFKK